MSERIIDLFDNTAPSDATYVPIHFTYCQSMNPNTRERESGETVLFLSTPKHSLLDRTEIDGNFAAVGLYRKNMMNDWQDRDNELSKTANRLMTETFFEDNLSDFDNITGQGYIFTEIDGVEYSVRKDGTKIIVERGI